jgi:hypothetical protein
MLRVDMGRSAIRPERAENYSAPCALVLFYEVIRLDSAILRLLSRKCRVIAS